MSETKKLFIGIDSGTSGIKAVVIDEDGHELFKHREKLTAITPYEDWYEEDMDEIWEKCLICLKDVLGHIDPRQVVGMAITAQGDGLWMMDAEGKAVRPGICFCDGRTGEIIQEWRESGALEKAFQVCGTVAFGSSMSAEIKWFERKDPDSLEKSAVLFHLKDWLMYKLTGRIATDETDMAIPMLEAHTKRYDDRLFSLYDIEAYRSKFPEVYPTLENQAYLKKELADELNMNEVLIIGGPMDICACALGSGAVHDGQGATIIGTAAIHSVIMNEPRQEPYMAGMTFPHAVPDHWIRLVSSLGGAPNLEWFLGNIGKELYERAEKEGKDVYDYCSEVIEKVPVGSNGVVYHPYLMAGGERAPFFKSNIKASFSGISFNTTVDDMLRAVYEGIAMAMVDCYGSIPMKLKEVYVSGGGSQSDVWMQMFADAMDTEIVISEGTEFGAKGAAMGAGIALGIYRDVEDAVARAVREKKRFYPDKDNHKRYAELFKLYKAGYELSMDWWDMRSRFLGMD